MTNHCKYKTKCPEAPSKHCRDPLSCFRYYEFQREHLSEDLDEMEKVVLGQRNAMHLDDVTLKE